MNLVNSKHPNGCGPACFAMLCDVSYADAIAYFPMINFNRNGLTYLFAITALMDLGFAIRGVNSRDYCGRPTKPWPPAPFADRHLCVVSWPGRNHMVVMDNAGVVLDPNKPRPAKLCDYMNIVSVTGLFKSGS